MMKYLSFAAADMSITDDIILLQRGISQYRARCSADGGTPDRGTSRTGQNYPPPLPANLYGRRTVPHHSLVVLHALSARSEKQKQNVRSHLHSLHLFAGKFFHLHPHTRTVPLLLNQTKLCRTSNRRYIRQSARALLFHAPPLSSFAVRNQKALIRNLPHTV